MVQSRTLARRRFGSIVMALCFFLIFPSVGVGICAENVLMPSFGTGPVTVRMYTDYFCGPCRSVEPRIEYLINDLVKRNIIRITFIDTPVHKQTLLYTNYFLYILNRKNDLHHVLFARNVLFDAAGKKIQEKNRLEEFLRQKGIAYRFLDTKPTLIALNAFIKDDAVRSTPSCVIDTGSQKQLFSGTDQIVKALELLR
jgi:thiol:disulfide interchange protein DsbA